MLKLIIQKRRKDWYDHVLFVNDIVIFYRSTDTPEVFIQQLDFCCIDCEGGGVWVQGGVGADSVGGGLTMCVGDVLGNFFFLQRALGMLVTHGLLESGTGDFKGTSTSHSSFSTLFCCSIGVHNSLITRRQDKDQTLLITRRQNQRQREKTKTETEGIQKDTRGNST